MTAYQQDLVAKLDEEKKILAAWNGDFLNCRVAIKAGSKVKWQRFSFLFDEPEACQGSRLVGKMTGSYAEHFAKDAGEIIVAFSREVAQLEV